ncbi:MAG: GGDEF domain-containing protein, partial [Clostridia bacterium]|nr:GGDEF domain-containing protein [Clostridia bacterium]
MKNHRIAFFTADWNYELVETTLHGLRRYVEDHPNVSLCVFDCFGKDQGNLSDRSEYAIFDLADLSQFDGLLIQGNQIVLQSARDALARQVAEKGIPAVAIDCPIEGCTLVEVDNRMALHDITEHVIQRHGAKRLVHLTGILDNGCPESEQRRDGFLDACRENGVKPEDAVVEPCTWRTSDGVQVAQRWLREKRPLPDAFVCANDEMALGVMTALSEGGVRIPADVIVTGFDNVYSAELSSPRLSTVHRDNSRMNYMAMDVLIGKLEGRETRDLVRFPYALIESESCGCLTAFQPGYIRDKYYRQTRFLRNFYSLQDQMAEELFDMSEIRELRGIIGRNREIFGCDNIYLCVNDYYFDNYDRNQWQHDSHSFGDEMVLVCGGRGSAATPDDFPRFPTRELLPPAVMRDARFLVFYPLHYNSYSIGYLVMDGISEAAKLNLHKSIFSFLEIAIDNLRKKGLLRQLNGELDRLYVHDALTGLYNRFGYARYGQQTFETLLARDGGAQILFIDMDDMKGVNDRFGHECGDAAIRDAADILRGVADSGDFLMRYGGDEFMMIASAKKKGLEKAIQDAVERQLMNYGYNATA